jgi:hypothetical protein
MHFARDIIPWFYLRTGFVTVMPVLSARVGLLGCVALPREQRPGDVLI